MAMDAEGDFVVAWQSPQDIPAMVSMCSVITPPGFRKGASSAPIPTRLPIRLGRPSRWI